MAGGGAGAGWGLVRGKLGGNVAEVGIAPEDNFGWFGEEARGGGTGIEKVEALSEYGVDFVEAGVVGGDEGDRLRVVLFGAGVGCGGAGYLALD